MTMSAPLAVFLRTLKPLKDSSEFQIVQDNCAKLSDDALQFLSLCYRDSHQCREGCSRWDSCEGSDKSHSCHTRDDNEGLYRPVRRGSLEPGADKWTHRNSAKSVDTIPHMPPRDATARASLRWAVAMQDEMDAVEYDDDDSSYGTESEVSMWSDFDFDDYETDSDSDDDESSYCCDDDEMCGTTCNNRWASEKVNAHDWSFPHNAILPNMQEIFRKAALNRDFDINKTMQALAVPTRQA